MLTETELKSLTDLFGCEIAKSKVETFIFWREHYIGSVENNSFEEVVDKLKSYYLEMKLLKTTLSNETS